MLYGSETRFHARYWCRLWGVKKNEDLVMNFDILSEKGLIRKYSRQSSEGSQSVRNCWGWEEWLPESVPKFEWIVWSLNSYSKLKRSLKDRHTQTHGNCIEIFRKIACRNISIQFVCACPSVISSISGKSFHFPFH
jgi:hypothetical protein